MCQMNSELVPLTLTIKIKWAFKLQQFLKKKLNSVSEIHAEKHCQSCFTIENTATAHVNNLAKFGYV